MTFVRPTQGLKRHPLTSVQNVTEIVPGEPLHRGKREVKRKSGTKIERWWTFRRLYLIVMSRSGISTPDEFTVSLFIQVKG